MIIFLFLTFTILVFVTFFIFKESIYKKENDVLLEKEISNFISTGIEWVPLNAVKISEEKKEALINFFETLEEDDDVQNIYSNVKFSN